MKRYSTAKIIAATLSFVCVLFAGLAQAACPTTPGRFVTNGAEVNDSRTGLIWQRCSAGQNWNGSVCTGSASGYTHEQALVYAKSQNPTNNPIGWRLPNVKELSSLADKGCQKPAVDSTSFPATPSNSRYWTSSPYVQGGNGYAWYVHFDDGFVFSYGNRSDAYLVRLVRTSQ